MTRNDALSIADTLAQQRPDRGNRYSSRTVRTKGAAAWDQWASMSVALAIKFGIEGACTPAEFLARVAPGENLEAVYL